MKTDKIIWSIIAFFAIVFSIAIYATRNATTFENVDNQQRIIDSLQQEIFAKDIELGRYEVAIDLLEEKDSSAAAKFEECLGMTE